MKKNPLVSIWELGESEHGRLKASIVLAAIGVISGIVPYFCAARLILGLLGGIREFSYYLICCGIALITYIIKTVFYGLALGYSHEGAFRILKNIRIMVLEKLPKLPLGAVMDIPSGKLKQIIIDQVESMEVTLAHLMPEMTSNLAAPLLVLIYLFVLDWRMALLSLVSIPLGMVFMSLIMRNYQKDYEQSVVVSQEMNETIVEYINGIEVIKAYNQSKNSYEKFSDKVNANAAYFYGWMKKSQLGMALAFSIAPTTLITILPFGIMFYLSGSLSPEKFFTIIILSLSIVGPLIEAMNFIDELAKVGTIVDSVNAILCAEEQNHGSEIVHFKNDNIVFENVSFAYDGKENVLKDVSLEIKEGSVNALVGPSGSGKSTIAKLIAGFWDVDEGRISIGGVNVKDVPLSQLYDKVAFVSQDNFLFDDTVMNNIRMGNLNATDDDVLDVAKRAGCHEFISNLEHGYNTVVGGGGAHVSGGEKQRISIARAMLKDAPIVVLDEATAYIDPENESIIQSAVAKLVRGKTLIIIAHRLSTIVSADKIIVVKDGSIESRGIHDDLLENCGLYRDMWKAHIGLKKGA